MAKLSAIKEAVPPQPPAQKFFSIRRVDGGWIFETIKVKDGLIIEHEKSQPDLKIIAMEKMKIANFNYWSRELE